MRNNRLLTRRGLLTAGAAFAAAGALPALALAQDSDAAAQVSVEELMQPGPLPELIFGRLDAPITLVEYASMTCPYCAAFHNNVLPTLRQKYISTGKLRLVLREFPLDNLAAAASMLGRCAASQRSPISHARVSTSACAIRNCSITLRPFAHAAPARSAWRRRRPSSSTASGSIAGQRWKTSRRRSRRS
jgi:Thioredoxin